ncbi:MAG: penicillin-binding transpeptidase domain-containing protein, partial [Patulibacter sp.]|nr:penicillin-binding transpeptidase domain-containing protein [Patulibacter sp.]
RDWSLGDNVGLAVGQGDLQVTPLQSAVMYSAIENGGKIVTPHFAKALQDPSGALRQTFNWPAKHQWDLADTGALSTIREGLFDAANAPDGTSYGVFKNWPKDKYPIYGKTGTAQKNGHLDQSWYAAYVPDRTHPIVIVATVEDGGFGAATAAPIVGEMLKTWFKVPDAEIVKGDDTSQ